MGWGSCGRRSILIIEVRTLHGAGGQLAEQAVSYTHLDVYKRQVLPGVREKQGAGGQALHLPPNRVGGAGPCLLYTSCWAEIDLDALAANYRRICRHAGGPVCAVIKADGYGHGALAVADVLHAEGLSLIHI